MFGNMSFEGIARGSSRRPWLTIAVWVVLIVGAGVLKRDPASRRSYYRVRFHEQARLVEGRQAARRAAPWP